MVELVLAIIGGWFLLALLVLGALVLVADRRRRRSPDRGRRVIVRLPIVIVRRSRRGSAPRRGFERR